MILAIDIGNTHISFGGVCEDGSVTEMLRIATDHAETRYGYAVKLKQVLELAGIDPAGFTGAALSSVVPPITETVKEAVRLAFGHEPLCVGAGVKTGLHIAIDDPGTIAGDLVAGAVAAKQYYPLPCVIVDMGTATTVMLVDETGRFSGGCILPGAGISLEALSKHAALLPRAELAPPQKAIPTNTADCMRAGIVWGAAGAVDGILDRFAQTLGSEPACILATGGLGAILAPHCRHAMTVDPALVLKGLALIWRKTKECEAKRLHR